MKFAKIIFNIVVVLFFLVNLFSAFVHAAPEDRLKGYAWSSNIGWISMNCSNDDSCYNGIEYGVDMDSSGNLSGFAWSSNVGWLDFSYYTGADAPKIDLVTGNWSGKTQFLAGLEDPEDGWAGILQLSGTSPNYGVIMETAAGPNYYKNTGYAWGETVVSWVNFDPTGTDQVTVDPFSFRFTASAGMSIADALSDNGTTILEWETSGGVTGCTASNGGVTNWTTSPSGANKSPGTPIPQQQTMANLVDPGTGYIDFGLTCTDGTNDITRILRIYIYPPAPLLSFSTSNYNVPFGALITMDWSTYNVATCTASGDSPWTGAKTIGINQTESGVGPLELATQVYYMTCSSTAPTYYPNGVEESITVYVEKVGMDFWAEISGSTLKYQDNIRVPYNEKVILKWNTDYATNCQATGDLPGWLDYNNPNPVPDGPGEVFWESAALSASGALYTATLTCDPSSGNITGQDPVSETINIKVLKNPSYGEI